MFVYVCICLYMFVCVCMCLYVFVCVTKYVMTIMVIYYYQTPNLMPNLNFLSVRTFACSLFCAILLTVFRSCT